MSIGKEDYKIPSEMFNKIWLTFIEIQAVNERENFLSCSSVSDIEYIISYMESRINSRLDRMRFKNNRLNK